MLYTTAYLSIVPKSLLAATLLLCWSGVSWSQVGSAPAERLNKPHPVKQAHEDPLQRRAALRTALEQLAQQNADTSEKVGKARRQLTAQERQVLREQLRQQRNDAFDAPKHD